MDYETPASSNFSTTKKEEPIRSIEGWIILITGIHEEAQEEDLHSLFAEAVTIKDFQMNLDRRTGFVKGYALMEFQNKKHAERALTELKEKEFMGKQIDVNWAF